MAIIKRKTSKELTELTKKEILERTRELKYNLIGIAGKAEVGKDTLAKYIQKCYLDCVYDSQGIKIVHNIPGVCSIHHFADPLKEAAMAAFGFTYEEVYTTEGKKTVNEFWRNTPRHFLQRLGTECFRNIFMDDFWLIRAELELKKQCFKTLNIFADIRFENECDWIRNQDGLIIHVSRDMEKEMEDSHSSEQTLEFKDSDIFIENDGSLEDLRIAADLIVEGIIIKPISDRKEEEKDQDA